jgi:DNA-binding transcriptional ArsR family regulator
VVADAGSQGGRGQYYSARKWLARYGAEGPEGLLDRSSAPKVVANRTDERRLEVIAALRRLRMTGAEIAECLGMALSTVSGILTRIGMGKLGRIGLEPAERYERVRPANWCTSRSRSSAGSTPAPVTASPADQANAKQPAGAGI